MSVENFWKCSSSILCSFVCLRLKDVPWDTYWQGKVCWATLGVQRVRKGARHSVTISFPPLPCPIHHLSSGLVRPAGELAGNELSVLSSSPVLHCVLVGGNELSVLSYRPLCPAESQHWPVTCSIWGAGYQYLQHLCHLTTHYWEIWIVWVEKIALLKKKKFYSHNIMYTMFTQYVQHKCYPTTH